MDPDEKIEAVTEDLLEGITEFELVKHAALIEMYAERFPQIADRLWQVHDERCEWYEHCTYQSEPDPLDFAREKLEFKTVVELFHTVRPSVPVEDLTNRCERLISAAQYCMFTDAPYHIELREALAAVWHLLEWHL